jgi:hypothetical protein
LLYAGTETGMYISFDDGENWQPLQLNLPIVPITDLVVHKGEKDLVAATQGRAFWVLDDLSILHQAAETASAQKAALLKPEDTYRMQASSFPLPPTATIGKNPPNGAVIHYYLPSKPDSVITLEFLDQSGKLVRKFSSRAPEKPLQNGAPGSGASQQTPPEQPQAPSGEESGVNASRDSAMRVPAEAGMNRFVWNLRYPDATRVPGMILWSGELTGPVVVPGTYQVKLTVDGKSQVQSFEVKRDPRVQTSAEDFAKQFDLLMKIRDKLTETHSRILEIREVRRQVSDLSRRLQEQPDSKRVIDAGRELSQKLTSIEEALYQTRNQSSQDPLNYPIRLNNKLAALAGVVSSADAAPTAQSYVVYEELVTAINAELQKLSNMMNTELVQFNELAREYRVPAVIIKQSVKEGAGQ